MFKTLNAVTETIYACQDIFAMCSIYKLSRLVHALSLVINLFFQQPVLELAGMLGWEACGLPETKI